MKKHERRHVFKLFPNKILHLCSEKAEHLNNCMLPQPAVVLRELSSRHLGLFCFNQKREHLTLRKHVWFAWAFEIFYCKRRTETLGEKQASTAGWNGADPCTKSELVLWDVQTPCRAFNIPS